MPIAHRDQTQLAELYQRFKGAYPSQKKEDFFVVMYATKKLKCAAEEVLERTNFESPEIGIDAYFLDRASRNLYLFLAQWTEDQNKLKGKLGAFADGGMQALLNGVPSTAPKFVASFQADLQENRELVDRVYVQCLFKGDTAKAEKSAGLSDRRERIESQRHLLERWFGQRDVALRVEFVADRRAPAPPPPVDVHELEFVEKATISTSDGAHTLHIGFMRLMDLHRIHVALEAKFFDRNIRFGLSADNPPNRKIREALNEITVKKTVEPELFAFHHNGITLAVQNVDFDRDRATVRGPRLLNGAQTVSSLRKFLDDFEGTPLQPDRHALERIQVIAKLVVGDPWSDFITNITISNNQQNPVEPWNLRANDRIQCDLADRFLGELGLFYSRQENAFEALSYEEREDLGVLDTNRSMTIRHLAQTFLASQGELVAMTHLPIVFESQQQYETAFKPRYLETDPRRIVVAYKAGLMLNRVFAAMEERSTQWLFPAIRRSRNLIWALLIQGLLNARDVEDILDAFGRSLTHELLFGEHLKELGSVRVLNVLKEVYGEPAYREKIDAEKYTFTKTKEAYQRCMQVASDRYGWTKRAL